MSEFTPRNWKMALASVFERAMRDPEYRSRCLTDPKAAMNEVSDIELPPTLKFQFLDSRNDMVYPYILPPALTTTEARTATSGGNDLNELIRWATVCSDPTCEDVPR